MKKSDKTKASLRILFVCTSNKDRSPALEKYFSKAYKGFECRSAGINRYFCKKKGTHLIEWQDLIWANLVVYAEDIHKRRTIELIAPSIIPKPHVVLNCGEYKQGHIGEDYIAKAEDKIIKKVKKITSI